ncbi:hypothetical protein SAMN05421874_116145 [Nonomuraea maritima]|uniref:Uncharacterized protein n=1 Tax=Nonomuraea maritima TaxID=683260 RepID=A0A1G9HPZ0_9ACTN|nr:hypothetical protein [Nonomuraea maritima]SDL15028.1 hypothetical protein SAMN05421874_116145 [Nonomuraea maritima]
MVIRKRKARSAWRAAREAQQAAREKQRAAGEAHRAARPEPRDARPAQRVDVARLPDDVVALIDALEPGENLILTRDGASIATVTSTVAVVHGAVVRRDGSDEAGDPPPADYDGVTVVATAMQLSTAARVALATQLGCSRRLASSSPRSTTTSSGSSTTARCGGCSTPARTRTFLRRLSRSSRDSSTTR